MSKRKPIALQLDWPPSMNTYWRRSGHVIYLSAKGRKFKEDVGLQCVAAKVTPIAGRVAVQMELSPPTRTKIDIDNRIKPTLDALIGHCFEDDEQVDKLIVIRKPIVKYGGCFVIVSEL